MCVCVCVWVNIGMCTLSPSCKQAMIGTGTFSTPSKRILSETEEFPGGLRPAAAAADEVDSGDVALARGESIFELAAM